MTFERFAVVRVPFPFTDREATKNRPALVLSDSAAFVTEDFLVLDLVHREQPVPEFLKPRLEPVLGRASSSGSAEAGASGTCCRAGSIGFSASLASTRVEER
ncbi:MAG: hypothetical protein KatS3mg110_2948 [Pirellulaceae bacterium]|nr:MAG: hypothetical protein KatS3mg110_2948 [Pirellulaceae bacterium]